MLPAPAADPKRPRALKFQACLPLACRQAGQTSPMSQREIIERDGRRWWVRPDAARPLLEAGWPAARPERLTLVKRGAGRAVYRCSAGDASFYVKAYAAGGPLTRLRALLGLGPGRREWDAIEAAREAGLDVPEPVALSRGAEEILVTREVPGAERLDEYLFERYFEAMPGDPPYPGARPPELVSVFRRRRTPPPGTIAPRALAERLADLVAGLARADLYLPDLHPGNIMISGGPGEWRLSLVDLAEVQRPAGPESLLEHLIQLEHFFEPIASVSERMRCLARLGGLVEDTPGFARAEPRYAGAKPGAAQVASATAAYRQRFYRHRDRRTRRPSKYFRRIAVGGTHAVPGWRGWATADWADAVERFLAARLRPGVAGPDDPLAGADTTVLKDGRTSTVRLLRLDDGRTLVVKRHNRADERGLGPSRSVAAFRRGHALLARGIATARPAAALDRRRRGAVEDTLLLTEPVAGEPLTEWLRRGPAPAARRHVTWELARLVRRLHEAGFSHRDLKAPNILVAPCGAGLHRPFGGAQHRPVLVDLDGLRMGRRVAIRRRLQNLMRLSVSLDEAGVGRLTDRMRFLRTYLGRRGCPRAIATASRRRGSLPPVARRLRRWWKRLARLSARKMERLRRKPVAAPGSPRRISPAADLQQRRPGKPGRPS